MTNTCIEAGCDKETRGVRCWQHSRRAILVAEAHKRAADDAALLRDVSEGLTAQRLAVRVNRSRQWADRLIRKAQRRQKILAGL